jgi:hypothetical protein
MSDPSSGLLKVLIVMTMADGITATATRLNAGGTLDDRELWKVRTYACHYAHAAIAAVEAAGFEVAKARAP